MPILHIEARLRAGARALPSTRGTSPPAAIVQLEFVTPGGQPLNASEHWSRTAEIAGPGLVACLAHLPRGDERLLVSLSATLDRHEAHMGETRVKLRSQDIAYLRFALDRNAAVYVFLAYEDEDNRVSEVIFETEIAWLEEIVSLGWEWHSFRGYVMEQPRASLLRELVELRDIESRRLRELDCSICVLEDWADGTALRISSLQLTESQLASRVDMNAIQSALDRSREC